MDIHVYDGVVDAEKLDDWLNQLESYFTLYGYTSSQKVTFVWLKLSNYALT